MTKSRETADLNNGLDVDASGNVGIGTGTPTVPLTVSGAAVVGSSKTQLLGSAFTAWSDTGAVAAFRSNEAGTSRALYIDIDNATGVIDYDASGATSGIHTFSTGGTERMRIDSSGNVGIGTAAPATMLHLLGDSASKTVGLFLQDSNGSGRNYLMNSTAGRLTFRDSTAAVDRITINSSGNVLVGTTTTADSSANGHVFYANGAANHSRSGAAALSLYRPDSNGTIAAFWKASSNVGTISVTGSATAYNTSSDYRLKENITPVQGAADIVKAMQPVTYTFKSDGSWHDGFLAHELQELHPRAVTGSKDAVDEEGNPDYQGVDYSKLTPILTAALQEALNKIDALEAQNVAFEARLTALEAV